MDNQGYVIDPFDTPNEKNNKYGTVPSSNPLKESTPPLLCSKSSFAQVIKYRCRFCIFKSIVILMFNLLPNNVTQFIHFGSQSLLRIYHTP